jgi:molybdopterin-guanine dinucleotide biosynthesis protein A
MIPGAHDFFDPAHTFSRRPNPMNAVKALLASTRVFILSGGAAKRAGGMNKSLIPVEGKPIIEHQIERLATVFKLRCGVITDRPADYEKYDLSTLTDFDEASPEERYPLRGFARALAETAEWSFILASDMPWPDPGLIRAQAEWIVNAQRTGAREVSGIVLRTAGRIQPFHAFYHGSLAHSARAALAGDDRSLHGWIRSQPSIGIVDLSALAPEEKIASRAFEGFNAPPREA